MTDDLWHSWYISTITTARIWREKSTTINSLSSSLWHNTSLKQQLSQSEDDYEILSSEIYNYKLVVVLSLAQHISKATVESKRGRLRDFAVWNLQLYKLIVVLSLAQHISKTTIGPKPGWLRVCSMRLQTEKSCCRCRTQTVDRCCRKCEFKFW